jgi:hypothetical protein
MPGTCCVCQDEMDMEDFNDERTSTETCYKLECGHAFHTRCIFQYLRETEYECLHCNVRRSPREEIELTGYITQAIEDLRADPETRRLRREVEEAATEFKSAREEVKKALEAAAPEILERAGYASLRKETLLRIRRLKAYVKEACIRRNPMTAGVWGIAGDGILNRAFIPTARGLHTSYLYLKI